MLKQFLANSIYNIILIDSSGTRCINIQISRNFDLTTSSISSRPKFAILDPLNSQRVVELIGYLIISRKRFRIGNSLASLRRCRA